MSHSFETVLADRNRFHSVERVTREHLQAEGLSCFGFTENEAAQASAVSEIEQRLDEVAVYKITYRSGLAGPAGGHDDLLVHGFVAVPLAFSSTLPLVLFNRGGNNQRENKNACKYPPHRVGRLTDSDAVFILGRLASWGYCAAASQYRGCYDLSQKDEFGGNDLNDVVNLRALFENCDDVGSDRVRMLGYSRGALMSFLLAARYDWISSIVAVGGLYDNKQDNDISKSPLHLVDQLSQDLAVRLIHANRDIRPNCATNFDPMLAALQQRLLKVSGNCFDSSQHYVLDHDEKVAELIKNWFDGTL